MNQTDFLALWGAVTGTIGCIAGLWTLRLKSIEHKQDKPKLILEGVFKFSKPDEPNHKIKIRSVGRRPVTLDSVTYYIFHKDWKQRYKFNRHKNGQYLWKQPFLEKKKLQEGESFDLRINLPNGLSPSDIYKVTVTDQAGTHWDVNWPTISKLKKIATQECLYEVTKENDKRCVVFIGYRLGEEYYLQITFNSKPPKPGPFNLNPLRFKDKHRFQDRVSDLLKNQIPQYLSGEVDIIE